eukprot:CAMPEP_0113712504 /NCGR_PEP_ID=MMETSP0038_2-20120614/31430_1 /TAXON_ID=2898 /ORGANISM="Cryptomonas paramecium" /LENGTH=63 /DNA_ID=CAMNT_0000639041 /DNA_START=24 /DNA_END=212 /DNA_ORIENTATION=+ /assembly_acc=CAM_ASM_000170
MLPGGAAGSQLVVVHAAIARASVSSTFFSASPLAASLCKPLFRVLFVGIALFYIGHVVLAVQA